MAGGASRLAAAATGNCRPAIRTCRHEPVTIVRPGPELWSNAELGLELGDQEGVFLRSVLGVGVITADGAENQPRGESRRGFVLPYLGFTIGSTL